jgi:phage gp46-like protein
MDLALAYSPQLDAFDLAIDHATADFVREDSLATAMVLSLMCDRTAQPSEVDPGADRRGWWPDAFAEDGDRFGSRLWLLEREKQTEETLQRARAYIREALVWVVVDGFATGIELTVFAPQRGWLVAQVALALDGGSRRYRFEWNDATQVWRLAGELS